MKKIKLCSVVVLGLLAVTPVHASDNWLLSLFPWLNVSGGGNSGGDPSIPDPAFGISTPIYTPSGGGNSGGDPSIPDPH
ncbi:hypothetical protein [Alteromonas sp. a30]|uniref:hypothetical protein n=1 Tax=Alteromonas sp. a30 TaxID=2730917 RepID=UPI00227F6E24|nr:hypothetical protein [Alteromonas sp. a30]MCY7295811.1 hypothetical protein [Alteromonas sp. a30]